MAKIVLDPITSGYQSTSQVNNNNADIASNLNDQILYRNNPEGESNEMLNLLDMNLNRIINCPDAINLQEPVTLGQFAALLAAALGDSGSGEGGINLPFVTESTVLSAGQLSVSYSGSINLSVFSISDLSADSHRLIENVDYTLSLATSTITLLNSYPAGTTLLRYREQAPLATDTNTTSITGVSTTTDASGAVVLNAQLGQIGTFVVVTSGNVTNLSITNAPMDAGLAYNPRIIVQSGGAFTVTMDSSIKFATGPTFSVTLGNRDHIDLNTLDNGATYDAFQSIADVAS